MHYGMVKPHSCSIEIDDHWKIISCNVINKIVHYCYDCMIIIIGRLYHVM
jgi:hypothetical protein